MPRSCVRAITTALLALLAVPFTADAQAHDATARMQRVAEGVYAIIHDNATEVWPNSNTGVVVGDDGVLVVDATYLPSRAAADIALIRTITNKPVRYVVITHLHRDHNGGTSAYVDAFPGVHVVSGPYTRDFIAINRAATARAGAADGSPLRKTLASLEVQLAKGTDSAGQPLAATARRALGTNVQQRRQELADLTSLRVIPPDIAVHSSMEVFLGGRRVVIRDCGRANSPDDVMVELPNEHVLFTGDIVVQAPIPYLGASWPVEWAAVLREIESQPAAMIVPGHGPVMQGVDYVHSMRLLIESVNKQVAVMLAGGLTLDQMKQRVDVKAIRAMVAAWTDPAADDDWTRSIEALVERAWHELRGLD